VAVDVLTEIVIERPCEAVASYAANPDNAPAWYVNIRSVEWQTQPAVSVGSKMAFVAQFLGRRLAYTYEIVDLSPGQRLVMRTAQGPFPMETTYTWETTSVGRTKMTLRNRGMPSGFGVVLGPFMAMAMRRANQRDLARLKAILEAQVN
jgi:uncharacterized membrane protein